MESTTSTLTLVITQDYQTKASDVFDALRNIPGVEISAQSWCHAIHEKNALQEECQLLRDNIDNFKHVLAQEKRLSEARGISWAQTATAKECITIVSDIHRNYPLDIFPGSGRSVDCQSAEMARITCERAASEIRNKFHLVSE